MPDAEEAKEQAKRESEEAMKTEAGSMLAEKEAEISRLEAVISRGDLRLDKAIYHGWKLGWARAGKEIAGREAEKAKEKAKREAEEAKQALPSLIDFDQEKQIEECLKEVKSICEELRAGKIETKEAIQRLLDISERINR